MRLVLSPKGALLIYERHTDTRHCLVGSLFQLLGSHKRCGFTLERFCSSFAIWSRVFCRWKFYKSYTEIRDGVSFGFLTQWWSPSAHGGVLRAFLPWWLWHLFTTSSKNDTSLQDYGWDSQSTSKYTPFSISRPWCCSLTRPAQYGGR